MTYHINPLTKPLRMLDTFSGSGGASYAAHNLIGGGIVTKKFVEIDPDAQAVLKDNFGKDIDVHDDIKTLRCKPSEYEIIWNSFPCSGTSGAGNKTGLEHEKSRLWVHGIRALIESESDYGIIEQPIGVIHRGLRAILGALRMAGYVSEIEIVSAAELGAGHLRKRLFIVSHTNRRASLFTRKATAWTNQVREMVQRQKDNTSWLTVERGGNGNDYGISPESLQLSVPRRTKGRIRARYLAGRTVTPLQASIPLLRVKYLQSIVEEFADE